MKPDLSILKREGSKKHPAKTQIRFAVVDLAKSNTYPENFLCVLPEQLSSIVKADSDFAKIFGDKSLELAKQLLTNALEREEDPEVEKEIKKRLKLLRPRKLAQKKCSICGNLFSPRGFRAYQQKFCENCMRNKHQD